MAHAQYSAEHDKMQQLDFIGHNLMCRMAVKREYKPLVLLLCATKGVDDDDEVAFHK